MAMSADVIPACVWDWGVDQGLGQVDDLREAASTISLTFLFVGTCDQVNRYRIIAWTNSNVF